MLNADHIRDDLAPAAEAYVQAAFGVRLDLEPIAPTGLPNFLLDRYQVWKGTLFDRPTLFVAWKAWQVQRGFTADFLKHREILRRQLDVQLVVLLIDRAPALIRRQLVERRIAFLVPGAQLYVPEALLDLRERGTRAVLQHGEQLTPTAQLLILAALQGEPVEDASLTELAKRLGVAIMSMTRALDELEALKITRPRIVGRQRRLHMPVQGKELWQEVEGRLQTPVRKLRTVRGVLDDHTAPRAGETALAHYTMLTAPRVERRAIAALRWKAVAPQLEDLTEAPFAEGGTEIETWSYDPFVLARDGMVDPLSLYLSVRNDPDERVAQAAEQLLEPFGW